MAFDYVFIDLSYFIIHKYFGILTWLKLTQQDPLDQKGMFRRFRIVFEDALVNFQKRYKFDWSKVVLAKDTPREMIWRNAIFPDYKKARSLPQNKRNNDFDPAIFKYVLDEVIPSLAEKYGGLTVMGVDGAEADDIVAIAHRYLRKYDEGKDSKTSILIITNDNDYMQLLDDNTTIANANNLELKSRFDETMLSVFLEWKIIKGDLSDSIPSIARLVGDKTALKLALDKKLLEKKFESDPGIRERYDMNKRLISFACIPDDIANNIIDVVQKTISI